MISLNFQNGLDTIADLKFFHGHRHIALDRLFACLQLSCNLLDLDIVPVSFNGSAPAIQSTLGGHTPIAFTVATPAVPQVKEGLLRALAVTSAKRLPVLPDIPTLAEAGLPNQESDSLMGVLAPACTPEAIITLLNREIVSAINQPDIAEKLAGLGFEAVASSPTEFAARIESDISKWAQVIRAANIKAE